MKVAFARRPTAFAYFTPERKDILNVAELYIIILRSLD